MLTKGMLRDRARGMRKQASKAEAAVWSVVRSRQIEGAKFRRQYLIQPYIADFACVEAKLVVEVDGRSHDDAKQVASDASRTEALNKGGWRVLRLRDDDVLSDPQSVARKIAAVSCSARLSPLNPLPPLGGRGQGEGGAPAARD